MTVIELSPEEQANRYGQTPRRIALDEQFHRRNSKWSAKAGATKSQKGH